MRSALAVVLGLLAAAGGILAAPAAAEEQVAPSPTAPAPDETRLNELTAQYTLLYQVGAHEKAIPVTEQALAAAETAFGPDHERVAQVLNDLGRLHELLGELEPAAHAHERALKIRDRVFNANGPEVAQSLNNLARVYIAQGRRAEAKPLYARSLVIMDRHVPPESPMLLFLLEPYAALLRDVGELDAAAQLEARIQMIHAAQAEHAAGGPSGADAH